MFAGGDAGVRIKGGDVRMRDGNVRRREMPGGRGEDERNMFAQEMIAMRNQRGWTQEETAAKMLVSTSTIANIETGYRTPTAAQAAKADEVFGTPGTFQRHEQRMRGIPFSAGFRPFQPYEEEARVLRMFEHTLVPGLFQVEGYARAILETHFEVTEQDVKDRVDARIARNWRVCRKSRFRSSRRPVRIQGCWGLLWLRRRTSLRLSCTWRRHQRGRRSKTRTWPSR
jgi:transcriptional regulator with XRE-family HTH domain